MFILDVNYVDLVWACASIWYADCSCFLPDPARECWHDTSKIFNSFVSYHSQMIVDSKLAKGER
jgi:hypothetical protein